VEQQHLRHTPSVCLFDTRRRAKKTLRARHMPPRARTPYDTTEQAQIQWKFLLAPIAPLMEAMEALIA
jgi:hypothetical protein